MPRRPSTHVDDPRTAGRRLAAARRAAGLTQRELSFAGCTPAYISRIEAGARVPSHQILLGLSKRLGVSVDYLAVGAVVNEESEALLLEAAVMVSLGDLSAASERYSQVASKPEARASARASAGLGELAFRRGEHEKAIALLSAALESGLPEVDAAGAAEALAQVYIAVKRYADAYALLRRFLSDAVVRGDRFEELRFRNRLAEAFLEGGGLDSAREVLTDITAEALRTLEAAARPLLSWEQSRHYARRGDEVRAARYAELTRASLLDDAHAREADRRMALLARLAELEAALADAARQRRQDPN